MFLVGSRSYSVIIGGSDTINGVSGRFRYVLPYLRVFLEGSRSYNVITGGSNPRDSGVMSQGCATVFSRTIVRRVSTREQVRRCASVFKSVLGTL